MIITVFEDTDINSLYPLNVTRASFELRCGAFTNLERIKSTLQPDDEIQLVVRKELEDLTRERYPQLTVNPDIVSEGIWLNGRCIWTEANLNELTSVRAYSIQGTVVAVVSESQTPLEEFYEQIEEKSSVSTIISVPMAAFIWDMIFSQKDVITSDAQYYLSSSGGKIHPSVVLENGDNIFITEGAEVGAGVVLDASQGAIIIDMDAVIDIGALVQGPVYIGKSCRVNPGAKLRGNITLGPSCKVGGEIEDVIMQGYGNKQHDGFLGHSYLGEWVNLGANTNNSDLKNNYGKVRIQYENEMHHSNQQFLGVMMGDFTRTGISTMFNTGTLAGIGANIFGSGFQEKYIPSFAWGKTETTQLEKLIDTIQIMKERRGKTLSECEKNYISGLYGKLFS
ncbi:MAG: putative sugar nucleotidyl transferase [Candidatus Marinimicrobia bacterium]|jgi:UDP-N-acetylglucosamine diphosphorylase/glucosamine-1-phosphate N-acetyltransferase|nr:putative sugar nucleotidyl transferase [Candidatus Neomarinimicrobiota bacterium]MDP6853271.1 putative sugar nucleotidyl transferase [Candidatus Neomarinimicrobiota bacterium]MDP6936224.1 putative sugar nucleotidyl transferase [Candidatus Neomarinimicrobiota bacterium]